MDPNAARRVSVKTMFDGTDITNDIRPYFLSMTYTDSEEDESDSLKIRLQDRDGLWLENWLEKAVQVAAASKLKLSVTIKPENWGTGGALHSGDFELDSVEASGPPSEISVSGVSLGYSSSVRQTKKSKAWEKYRLSGIAGEIAGNAGLSCMYESSSDPFYERVEQTNESDIRFLADLCHDAGISLKCSDGMLILFDQVDYEAKPPVMTIRRGGGAYISYSLSTEAADTQYGSCRVSYMDAATGKLIEGTAEAAGDDAESGQRLEITARVKDAGAAKALAEKQLRLHNKFNRVVSFTLPGNTTLVAGVTVRLERFGGWNGLYIVKKAEHTVDGTSGYTTNITLRKTL